MADYDFPDDLRYSAEDEWARSEDDRVVVGITDFAQDQLGDIVFVELPEIGVTVTKGDTFGVVESVKAVSDLYAPISGVIVDVNHDLVDSPETVNSDCYGDGWMVAIAPSDTNELDDLFDSDGYARHVDERSE